MDATTRRRFERMARASGPAAQAAADDTAAAVATMDDLLRRMRLGERLDFHGNGTPGHIPGVAPLELSLRTYLAAVVLWGTDAHAALRHLRAGLPNALPRYAAVADDSRLVDELRGRLTARGWAVLRAATDD